MSSGKMRYIFSVNIGVVLLFFKASFAAWKAFHSNTTAIESCGDGWNTSVCVIVKKCVAISPEIKDEILNVVPNLN